MNLKKMALFISILLINSCTTNPNFEAKPGIDSVPKNIRPLVLINSSIAIKTNLKLDNSIDVDLDIKELLTDVGFAHYFLLKNLKTGKEYPIRMQPGSKYKLVGKTIIQSFLVSLPAGQYKVVALTTKNRVDRDIRHVILISENKQQAFEIPDREFVSLGTLSAGIRNYKYCDDVSFRKSTKEETSLALETFPLLKDYL